MTLGEKIQKLRHEQNLSQRELAVKLNVSTADVAIWESDESIPSIADIAKLSSALGVTTDALIMDSEIAGDEIPHHTKEVIEKEDQPIERLSDKKAKVSKKKLAILISLSVIVVAVIGAFAYKLFLPFSKNTAAIEKAASSVVKIYCYDYEGNESATGSGFIAFDDQTVVTNYHVMEEAYTCKVSTDEDKTFEVESVLAYSKEQDLAIIKLKESTGLKVLKLGDSEKIKKGEVVTAIGSPLGIKNTVSQGVLSGRLMEENMDVLQFTAAISSGSSGGALFDESGKVIGVTYASFIDGQNLNLAIPSECVKILYDNSGSDYDANIAYMIEHPYVNFLDNFVDATEVTMEELKNNPEKYDNKIVKMETYVSSVLDRNGNLYVTNRIGSISNDFSNDVYITTFTDSYRTNSLLSVYANTSSLKYEDDMIQAGDKVIVIGEFVFKSIGEKVYSELFEEYIVIERERGEIEAAIIYRKGE